MKNVSLHLFRRCLRLHDNVALSKAIEFNSYLIPLFVLDPEYLDVDRKATNQMGFLLNTLKCLDEDLREKGSRLFVAKGKPADVVEKFIDAFNVNILTFYRDTDSYNRSVDEQVIKIATSRNLRIFNMWWGNTLYEMEDLLELCQGHPPSNQETFLNLAASVGSPTQPVDTPVAIPPPPPQILEYLSGDIKSVLGSVSSQIDGSTPSVSVSSQATDSTILSSTSETRMDDSVGTLGSAREDPAPNAEISSIKDYDSTEDPSPGVLSRPESPEVFHSPLSSPRKFHEKYSRLQIMDRIPTLSDLKEFGYIPEDYTSSIVPGEKAALQLMEVYFIQRQRLSFNCKPSENQEQKKWYEPPDKPISLMTAPQEVKLSPYIAWGGLSVRVLYQRLQKAIRSPGMTAKQLLSSICRCVHVSPLTLEDRLFSREYAYLISYSGSNFGHLHGMPTCVCMHIPWVAGDEAAELVRRWECGETGYPAVDACMNQLRNEGWIHDLCRHMVASFLTGGGLMVYWELGRNVFEKYLLDFDWSINSYHWHWLSCSAFFQDYFTTLDPTTFLKKCDPSGAFLRKYVPALKRFPDEFIYEPWKAPLIVQEAAGCMIGKDYPHPIINISDRSKQNMKQIRKITSEFFKLN